jgi:hypothetical protein
MKGHLVHHDAIDLLRLDVGQQAAQRRAVHVGAGEPAIVILIGQQGPSLAALAAGVRLAGTPLRVERVEVLIQAFLGRLPGVNSAP